MSNRLSAYKVNVKELNGVQTLTRQQIEETLIIVTTPEKSLHHFVAYVTYLGLVT
ncbi:unnamed protein product [Rhodiola kirilowii]